MLKCNLENINAIKQNTEGIDLIDKGNEIIVQVSSTCTKQKIESTLAKKIFKDYSGYHFKFIVIAGDADKLRAATFKNPYSAIFSPIDDIYDIKSLLNLVLNLSIGEQQKLYEFIRDELGDDIDIVKVDTNLAAIINILSKENLSIANESPEINPFEILRKIEFNNLLSIQPIIDDYKVFYSKLDEKYKEFDRQGANKSFSVLSIIRMQYNKLVVNSQEPYDIFFSIIDNIVELIRKSKNYIEIPYEELEMCVSILVVDAFIRCKIFKNPEGYDYAVAR